VKAIISFYQSSIGKKWIVALTGLVLVGFVTGHMIGNLQLFLGPEALNKYAEFLQGLGELLWVIRGFMAACLIVHILTTVTLWIQNKTAAPQFGLNKYAVNNPQAATISAKTMIFGGLIVFCFLAYHILHFTTLSLNPEWAEWMDDDGRHDVYSMVIMGFRNPLTTTFYLVGLFFLCLHLSHGIQSFIQTLGVRSRKIAQPISTASPYLAALIYLGYASMPIAVLLAYQLKLSFLQPLSH